MCLIYIPEYHVLNVDSFSYKQFKFMYFLWQSGTPLWVKTAFLYSSVEGYAGYFHDLGIIFNWFILLTIMSSIFLHVVVCVTICLIFRTGIYITKFYINIYVATYLLFLSLRNNPHIHICGNLISAL